MRRYTGVKQKAMLRYGRYVYCVVTVCSVARCAASVEHYTDRILTLIVSIFGFLLIVTDRISEEGNAIASVRLSVICFHFISSEPID